MPITALDKKTALVLIDFQQGIVTSPVVHPAQEVITNAVKLVVAFRQAGQLVVAVNVSFAADGADALKTRVEAASSAQRPAGWDVLVSELQLEPGDIRITKRNWSAFYGTELDLQLRRRGITGIVLAGIATSIGVEGTARSAHERGYNLSFATDAMTDTRLAAHEHSCSVIFPRIGETGTTAEIIHTLQLL